jgi:hypothetical protein
VRSSLLLWLHLSNPDSASISTLQLPVSVHITAYNVQLQ